jgi:hypothetical protein
MRKGKMSHEVLARLAGATLLVCAGSAALPSAARAQQACPDGKTFTGACVYPGLAVAARQNAIIFAQPKISQTAYPVMPSDDSKFRYPNQLIPDQAAPSPIGPKAPGGTVIIIF